MVYSHLSLITFLLVERVLKRLRILPDGGAAFALVHLHCMGTVAKSLGV